MYKGWVSQMPKLYTIDPPRGVGANFRYYKSNFEKNPSCGTISQILEKIFTKGNKLLAR